MEIDTIEQKEIKDKSEELVEETTTEEVKTQEEDNNQEEVKKDRKRRKKAKRLKKKNTIGQKIFFLFKILIIFVILCIIGIYLFFKTDLFQDYKELWVQTAMTTMNHQYLATWFLSDEEIAEIMKKLEVENNENSDSNDIMVVALEEDKKEITVERITGKGYVGFVMQVPDASKVKLVDGRVSRKRF